MEDVYKKYIASLLERKYYVLQVGISPTTSAKKLIEDLIEQIRIYMKHESEIGFDIFFHGFEKERAIIHLSMEGQRDLHKDYIMHIKDMLNIGFNNA